MSAGKPRKKARKATPVWSIIALVAIGAGALGLILVMHNRSAHPSLQVTPATAADAAPKTNLTANNTNQPPPTAADLENRAVALMAEGKVEEALAYLNRAVKLNPDDETTHFNLAYAYAKANR